MSDSRTTDPRDPSQSQTEPTVAEQPAARGRALTFDAMPVGMMRDAEAFLRHRWYWIDFEPAPDAFLAYAFAELKQLPLDFFDWEQLLGIARSIAVTSRARSMPTTSTAARNEPSEAAARAGDAITRRPRHRDSIGLPLQSSVFGEIPPHLLSSARAPRRVPRRGRGTASRTADERGGQPATRRRRSAPTSPAVRSGGAKAVRAPRNGRKAP